MTLPYHLKSLSPEWRSCLEAELQKPYFIKLLQFLTNESKQATIYPPTDLICHWSVATLSPSAVKVVILGQDPYHGEGQACGLAFSVPTTIKRLPPSLINIYKELEKDCGVKKSNGCLEGWAQQGVLLLNTVLTVRKGQAHSHANHGWEQFTQAIVNYLNKHFEGIVFVLWGNHAQAFGRSIDSKKHCVLKAAHPSPLSAERGFFGCQHFSKTNKYLESKGKTPIDWSL